jgi:hypothetical protein
MAEIFTCARRTEELLIFKTLTGFTLQFNHSSPLIIKKIRIADLTKCYNFPDALLVEHPAPVDN